MSDALHRRVIRVTEPQILFPLIATILLGALGAVTSEVTKEPEEVGGSHRKRFPLDTSKIARSLTRDLPSTSKGDLH
jgi:hypothetical protein